MSQKKKDEIYLRSYPKVIFFWPLLVFSFAAWLIQFFVEDPIGWLGTTWMIVFFTNLFVTAFDFSSTKFFVLILAIVITILLVAFFVIPNIPAIKVEGFNLGITALFYAITTLILVIILGFVVLSARFDYWKIERNEIYHKSGIFASAERYPTKGLRIKKEIPDVFEYFMLRAGKISLFPGKAEEVILLPTVLNIKKKEEQIDALLSYISVEPDEVD